jgi:hypothetical protein
MKLDVMLFGRIRSGPFFALLRTVPRAGASMARDGARPPADRRP